MHDNSITLLPLKKYQKRNAMNYTSFYRYSLLPREKKIILLSALGGMLEFYDFIIYGIFSLYFAHQFFPSHDPLVSVIESYVVFVLGYIARPIGGIIFSHIGDEQGRKKVLIITIIIMGLASFGIGLLPTYDNIGLAAPCLLLSLRLLQGLALGGELPSTYVYISESMPTKLGYGFGGVMTGVNAGLLLGMLMNLLLNTLFTAPEMESFAWRIPFILGGVLCLISYKIRKSLRETQAFIKIKDKPKLPLFYLVQHHLPSLLSGICITAFMSGTVVTTIIFMPTYLTKILHFDPHLFSHFMIYVMLANVLTIYLGGGLANTFSPQKMFFIIGCIALPLIASSYFLISLNLCLALAMIILGIIQGMAALLVPLLLTRLFPTQIRLTGVALSYNIGFTLFGGLAPIILTSLMTQGTNVYLTPILYLWGVCIIALLGFHYSRRTM
jgi:MFS family permease